MKLRFRSIPSWDLPVLPAMALMEVLAAAAILSAAIILFLNVLRDAKTDLARAESNTLSIALAQSLLDQAQANWPAKQASGEQNHYSWTTTCDLAPQIASPRLVLVICTANVRAPLGQRVTLKRAWAAVQRDAFLR